MNRTDKEFFNRKRPKKEQDVHLKDYDLGISYYQSMIKKGDHPTDAYVNLGFIYLDKED